MPSKGTDECVEISRCVMEARHKGLEVDPVFVVMRRFPKKERTPQYYEVLLGRHDRVKRHDVATLLQGNHSPDAEFDPSWKCLYQSFYEYIEIARAPDPITIGPPIFVSEHISYSGAKKLLIYVSVGMPVGTVFWSKERPNAFRDFFWHPVDPSLVSHALSADRSQNKALLHGAAITLAKRTFKRHHY